MTWIGGLLVGIALGMWIERAINWNINRLQRKLDTLPRGSPDE